MRRNAPAPYTYLPFLTGGRQCVGRLNGKFQRQADDFTLSISERGSHNLCADGLRKLMFGNPGR
ncbi:MAG: hypothetical protein ACREBD_08315 [Blastocatellia bacterium]